MGVFKLTQEQLKQGHRMTRDRKDNKRTRIYYTITPDELINDMRMSGNAKVLLLYMLNQSSKWQFYMNQLAHHFNVSRQTVSSWMKELMKYEYVVREKLPDPRDNFKYVYIYEVYPLPKARYWTVHRQWEAWKKSSTSPAIHEAKIIDMTR
jgi:predicted transcriptional regulator